MPTYAVFQKGSVRTYTAYNPNSSQQTVTFSDGFAMQVPARTQITSSSAPANVPTNSAPTPTVPGASVLALYNSSGVYTVPPGITSWNASWGSAIENPFAIANTGNVVLEYSSLLFAGVEFYNPGQIDAAPYDSLHVDFWTPTANQFGVNLVSIDAGVHQTAQIDFLPASGVITSNGWVSLDIPLSRFTAVNSSLELTNLQQLIWVDNQGGGGIQGGTFFIDNVYFWKASNQLGVPVRLPGGKYQLSFMGQPGSENVLEWTTNLNPPVAWMPQLTNTANTNNGLLIYTNVQAGPEGFWRTRHVP
jgi:hypothetical protein